MKFTAHPEQNLLAEQQSRTTHHGPPAPRSLSVESETKTTQENISEHRPVESATQITQEVVLEHQPQATPTTPTTPATQDLISKYQRDLNNLFDRKSHIQSRIAKHNKQAAYEEFEAHKVIGYNESYMADARKCLSEAAKLRELADEDQKEVDAIDQHLIGAMGRDRDGKPMTVRFDHTTPFQCESSGT